MNTFSLDQLVTIIQALRLYQGDLKAKLESMRDDDESYAITVDEMAFSRNLLQEVEKMHEKLYSEEFNREV